MDEAGQAATTELRSVFQTVLNRHGHPFQYAVVRRAQELRESRRSPWIFEVSEFPVEVQGRHARIDFVLRHQGEPHFGHLRFMVAECKRANPSLVDWVFVRAPYVRRNRTSRDILVERVWRSADDLLAGLGRLDGSDHIYDIGFEVKGGATGDPAGAGRGAIEDAATQLMRGVNGLVECLGERPQDIPENRHVVFVPVIFTIARVWTTEADLATTDPVSGAVDLGSSGVTRVPWLWLQSPVSPGLRHTVARDQPDKEPLYKPDLGEILETEYARAVAVVWSGGVDDFLASNRWTY